MLPKYKFDLAFFWKIWVFFLYFFTFSGTLSAQEFSFVGSRKKQTIKFKFVRNLIIIPLYINEKGPYDFVLDTGVGPMIITDPSIIDSLNFNAMRKIKVTGLGNSEIDAFISQSINAKVGRAKIEQIPTAILKEDLFNLSGHLGIKVYGLIGFSFFNSFIVDIRYSTAQLKFYAHNQFVKYDGNKIALRIENLKPYVTAGIELPNGKRINAKFLMDTGASHNISLESINSVAFPLPSQTINANLGMSLSGQIKGSVGRIKHFYLGDYIFTDVISGFPDFKSISGKLDSNRNGNIGADLLKRFDIQLNYKEGYMFIKRNSFYNRPFDYDMLGMVVYLDEKEYKRFIIGEIDTDSPAAKAGLLPDDEIIGVNFKSINNYTLSELMELFKSKADRNIIFEIYRDNQTYFKLVHLEKRI